MTSATAVPRDELAARAAELRPLLREDAEQADRDRVLTDRVVDALTEAKLFNLMVPKRLGGLETDATTMLDVVGELGRGDMSAAWVAGVLNFSAWQVGMFPEEAQQDVWGENPRARVCSVISPMVEVQPADGGIVVSGQWPSASGSQHSEWAVLTVPMSFGPQGPVFDIALIPMSDLTILNTWYPAGVRGSASNNIVAKDVFVPDHRRIGMQDTIEGTRSNGHPEEALYRASFGGMGGIATLAPQLGAADAMLEAVTERSQGRMVPTAGIMDQSTSVAFQMRVGEAAAKINVAWLLAKQAAADTDEWSAVGQIPPDAIRGRARINSAWASKEAYEAVESLMSEAGASAFMDDSPMQRIWRDVATSRRHTAYRTDPVLEQYGSVLLGKGPAGSVLF